MAFPLGTVLAAAPGIISAAADIIKLVRNKQDKDESSPKRDPQIEGLTGLIEKQALVIEELAKSNKELALAVRHNRLLALVSIAIAVMAVLLVLFR